MSEPTVGPSQLARALDVSERHVYRLAKLGMPKDGRGAYPLIRCARWYRTHVLSSPEGEDGPDLGEARLRKARARALEAERELARRREEVAPAEVWDEVTGEQDAWLREEVLDLADRWANALEGAGDPPAIFERLRGLVRKALSELRKGPPTWREERDAERAA